MLGSDWLLVIQDLRSHANVRKKSNIANRSKSHCERSHAICERSHANFKQKIACELRIANEVEMDLKYTHKQNSKEGGKKSVRSFHRPSKSI